MILYIILLGAIAWPSSRCEPPVNSYLPPSGTGPSGGGPSSQHGRNNGGTQRDSRPGGGLTQRPPQDSYSIGQNGQSIDTQYGPPSARGNGQGPLGFGSPLGSDGNSQSRGNTPSLQYGVPDQNNGGNSRGSSSSSNRGSGRRNENGSFEPGNSGQGPQTSYGPPPTGFGGTGPTSQRLTSQGTPDSSYSPPNSDSLNGFGSGGRQFGGSPSSTYGAPDFESDSNVDTHGGVVGRPGGNFGVSDGGFGGGSSGHSQNYQDGGDSNEPAKYEFSYDVDDSQTGTKFGHSEQRDGDLATGEYNVVLPDGRKQVVEYEAGTQGYKPQIRYEGGGRPGAQGGSQGYSQGSLDSGFSGSGQEQGLQTGRYQDAGGFGDRDSNNLGFSGYPSGRPGDRNGASSNDPSHGQSGSAFPSGSGLEELNGNKGGYPSGGPQGGSNGGYSSGGPGRNGGSSGNNENNEGYPRGGPGAQGIPGGRQRGRGSHNSKNNGRERSGIQSGDGEGYPSGGPSGPRGTGY